MFPLYATTSVKCFLRYLISSPGKRFQLISFYVMNSISPELWSRFPYTNYLLSSLLFSQSVADLCAFACCLVPSLNICWALGHGLLPCCFPLKFDTILCLLFIQRLQTSRLWGSQVALKCNTCSNALRLIWEFVAIVQFLVYLQACWGTFVPLERFKRFFSDVLWNIQAVFLTWNVLVLIFFSYLFIFFLRESFLCVFFLNPIVIHFLL